MQNALLEHSAIFLTCIKRYSILKPIFGLLFEWPLNTENISSVAVLERTNTV